MRKTTFYLQKKINQALAIALSFAFLALVIINLKTH